MMEKNNNPLLSIKDLSVSYANIKAVSNITIDVYDGEIVTLIGANGAGKSTTLRAVSGLLPYSGEIIFNGENLKNIPPDKIVAKGIAHVPEGRGIFASLTVMENLKLATWQRKDKHNFTDDYERIFSLFPRLKERITQAGGTLSGGEQQMLAVGRALMSKAKMVLLDEPSMGLSPMLVRDIFKIIVDINKAGITVLLVEQNAHLAFKHSDRGYVLETGNIMLSGTCEELKNDSKVKVAYLGG